MKIILPFFLSIPLFAVSSLSEEIPSAGTMKEKAPATKQAVFASCRVSEQSTDGLREFENIFKDTPPLAPPGDQCFQITPKDIRENSGYRIFKYNLSGASYLLYKGKVHLLGEFFGGCGITDARLADLNDDGVNELYFTFSWGSGIHRAQAGYFDPVRERVKIFNHACPDNDLAAQVVDGTRIELYEVNVHKAEQIKTPPSATIFYSDGKIQLIRVSGGR